jgi:sugar phosphate isomerase/epimerase
MKVSNLPYSLLFARTRDMGLPGLVEWARFCAGNGFDGIEIGEDWLHHLSWDDIVAFIEIMRSIPIEASGLTVHNHMNCSTAKAREEAAGQIKRYVHMARLLGAPSIRINSGDWGPYERYEMSRQQAIDNTVQTIEHCLPIAVKERVTLAVENHPGWVSLYADALVEILERVRSEYLVLNLDTGSLYREGQRPQDFLKHEIIARRTVSLHLKTIRFEPNPEVGRWNQTVPFEESDIDYRYILTTLIKSGFDGWLSYEAHEVDFEGLAAGARFARGLWAELKEKP